MRIALIGDYDEAVTAHIAIPKALALEGDARSEVVEFDWIETNALSDASILSGYDGGWVVPASPYKSFANALNAIQYLRENRIPFLGTCGGYQHALVEFARNALGHDQASITEIDPDCEMPLVSSLECALVEATDPIVPEPGGLIAKVCGIKPFQGKYRCSFGLNPDFENIFDHSDLKVSARDPDGAVRAMELSDHPFFLGVAFQPERAALDDSRSPLVTLFVDCVSAQAATKT